MNINPLELYGTAVASASAASTVIHLLFTKKGKTMTDGNVLMGVAPPPTTTPATPAPASPVPDAVPAKPDSDITDYLATLPADLEAITDDFKSKVSGYVTSAVTAASAVAGGVQTDLTSSEVRDMVATGQKVVAFLEALGK